MRTTADLIIRALRDGDYSALARIHNAIVPDAPTTEDGMREEVDRIDRSRFISVWLVAVDPASREVLAYGDYSHVPWSHHPAKFRGWISVHPDVQGRGIGSRMMDAILTVLRDHGAERFGVWTREDWPRSITFLQRYGFVEKTRDFESRLEVAGVDLGRFRHYAERASALAVTITTLAEELERNPACLPAVYQAHCVLDIDTPRTDPELPTPPTYEDFLRREIHHPRVLPDAFFLAKFRDFYIGESALKCSRGDRGLLHQELTAVLPTYRRLGIATALKLRTIEYAQRRGYRTIRTFNSIRNAPMLAINHKLGFVRQPAWIVFQKALNHEPVAPQASSARPLP